MTALWQEVGDRIFRRRYESLDLNIGLIITDESVVVIDSRANHRQADELREAYAPWVELQVSDSEDGWILMTGRRAAAA